MPWKPTGQYLRISFTVNLPDGKSWEDYDLPTLRTRLGPTLAYLLMGFEGGTEKTPRKHFQGYLEYSKKKLGSAMDRDFRVTFPLPISVHYEISSGSAEQNEKYCKGFLPDGSLKDEKPNEFYEWGTPAPKEWGKGARNDLATLFSMVKEGATDVALAEADPGRWAVHRKALSEYRALTETKRNWPMELIFLWGPTRTGKSAQAQHFNPESVDWTGTFLNGFNGSSETLLFDDFEWEKMSPKLWLKITDRYSMVINVKNGFKNFAPRRLIFTSNDDPKSWWPSAPAATREAAHARMDEFGKTTHLTRAQPWDQPLLSAFFGPPPSMAAPASAAPSGATKRSAPESDDEDDWATHSQPSQHELEHGPKGKQARTVIDLTQ